MSIKLLKVREVKDPQRRDGDAGIDIFVPEKTDEFARALAIKNKIVMLSEAGDGIKVNPHESILIPTGIKSEFDSSLALVAFNKSGIATKTGLIVGACVIDSSYQGEWHVHLINTTNEVQVVKFGQKITQFVPLQIGVDKLKVSNIKDVSEDEFFLGTTERGAGGFGSTGV